MSDISPFDINGNITSASLLQQIMSPDATNGNAIPFKLSPSSNFNEWKMAIDRHTEDTSLYWNHYIEYGDLPMMSGIERLPPLELLFIKKAFESNLSQLLHNTCSDKVLEEISYFCKGKSVVGRDTYQFLCETYGVVNVRKEAQLYYNMHSIKSKSLSERRNWATEFVDSMNRPTVRETEWLKTLSPNVLAQHKIIMSEKRNAKIAIALIGSSTSQYSKLIEKFGNLSSVSQKEIVEFLGS